MRPKENRSNPLTSRLEPSTWAETIMSKRALHVYKRLALTALTTLTALIGLVEPHRRTYTPPVRSTAGQPQPKSMERSLVECSISVLSPYRSLLT
jgi:hypothetical protein